MIHPLWSGTVSFGIVTIPVHLMPAIHEHTIHFHQISRSGRGRVHYKKVVHGKSGDVPAEDIIKGYEIAKNRYVTFKEDELKRLMTQKSQELEITEFVELTEIDPRYFNHLYYLAPGKNGAKPYQLLQRALQQAKRVGITRLVMHNKEHVSVLRSLDNVLALQTLHFADEIVIPASASTKGKTADAARITSQELALAGQLIDSMGGSFKPGNFKDDYTERIKRAIVRKAKGKPLEIEDDTPENDDGEAAHNKGVSLDLMEALDRSLGMRRSKGSGVRRGATPARDTHFVKRRTSTAVMHQNGRTKSRAS